MPIKGVKTCGARCRTKNGAPCDQPAMKETGRCKMHGGYNYLNRTHGRTTLRAQMARKGERTLLHEMKITNKEIKAFSEEISEE